MDEEEQKMVQLMVALAAQKVFLFGQRRAGDYNTTTFQRRFKSHCEVTPRHVVLIWVKLEDAGLVIEYQSAQIEHLMWTLDLLKTDNTEHVLRGRYQVDEKTIRKWTTIIIEALSELEEIDWENRHLGNGGRHVKVSIDGTDFRICEPIFFSPKWWSHKYNGPGVRYEIGVCIATGWIVWINGPYPPAKNTDLVIAKRLLPLALNDDEQYIADGAYQTPYAIMPHQAETMYKYYYMAWARALHEQINRLFKTFRCIKNAFKRDVMKHGVFTHAIASVLQIGIVNGEVYIWDRKNMPAPQGYRNHFETLRDFLYSQSDLTNRIVVVGKEDQATRTGNFEITTTMPKNDKQEVLLLHSHKNYSCHEGLVATYKERVELVEKIQEILGEMMLD